MRWLSVSLLLGSLAAAQPASAERAPVGTVTRGAAFASPNELSAQLGFQAALGGTTPGGFKLFFDYSRRLSDLVWFNVKLNPAFGASARTVCVSNGATVDCGIGFDANGD